MTITIGAWIIPMLITIYCLFQMFRPRGRQNCFDFTGAIYSLFYAIFILVVWLGYFVGYFIRSKIVG